MLIASAAEDCISGFKPGGHQESWEIPWLPPSRAKANKYALHFVVCQPQIYQILWRPFRADARCGRLCKLVKMEKPLVIGRIIAFFEVLLCSDYPTQLAVGVTLAAFGIRPLTSGGGLSLRYVVGLSLIDTALLVGLIFVFVRSHGERLRDVLLGSRPAAPEVELGFPLTIGAISIAIAVILAVQKFLPALHNVARNPLQDVIHSPRDAALFALVVVVAGGIREEIQRAFILHRFKVWLGGPVVGLVISSVAFGLGHRLQGNDVAIATGMLGLYWGVVYLRRRSCIASMVSHSGFNLIELLQYFVGGR